MSQEPIDWKTLYEKKTEDCDDLQISLDLSMQQADLMEEELEKQKSKLAATNLELVQMQSRLRAELDEAANYAMSILPQPILVGPPCAKWLFIPSTELGGDTFGYHWIDDDHFAIYLLDVCGHGVGAALMSISAMNVLRAGMLRNADFREPGQVLSRLNETFPMDDHNGMYFTIWYGVWKRSANELRFAAGGHPPALLVSKEGKVESLGSPQMVIGVMPDVEYNSQTKTVSPGDRIFVFSDGVYEIDKPEGGMMDYPGFVHLTRELAKSNNLSLESLNASLHEAIGPNGKFEDDFSLLEVRLDQPFDS